MLERVGRRRVRPITGSPRAVALVMCCGSFLVLLDVTIVNVALPAIADGLDAGVSELQWVVDGYAIALAGLMLGAGTAGDLRGHKRVVLAGLAVFGAASLGCGLAPGVGALVGFRVVQGAGAAMLLPATLAVIAATFAEPAERAAAIGLWAGVGGAALPAGPLLGGALVEAVGWRAVFLVNLPVVAAALALAARVVAETPGDRTRRLDLPGVVLGAALLALVTFSLIEGGHAGLRPPVAAAAVAAALLLAAFVAVERRAADPMLPLLLFRRPAFAVANAVAGTMNLCTLGLLFVLTLFLQGVQHRAAFAAGVALLPLFLPLGVLAPPAGRVAGRLGPRLPMAAGLLCAAAGIALLLRLDADSSLVTLLPAELLWGIGLGLLTPAVVSAAVGAVPGERAGLASAVNNTARQAGGAIGIAAFGALTGSPAARGFVGGLHAAAAIAAGMYVAAAAATLAFVRR